MDKQKAREAGISEASTAILVSTPSCYQAKLVYSPLSLSQAKKKKKPLNQTNKQKLILMLRGRRGEGRRNFM